MNWFLWAIGASLCAAALAECNRIFKLNATMLNAWRSTFGMGLLALGIPFMEWPNSKLFYVIAAIDGIVTAIGMILFLYLAAKRTGRVSSMILPISAIGAYFTWMMLFPSSRPDYIEHPLQVLMIVVSVTLICLAFQKVRDNDASWESFLIVLPVGVAFGVVDALTKWVMEAAHNQYSVALSYTFTALILCTIPSWLVALRRPVGGRTMSFFDKKLLWGGFWSGFWTAAMILTGVLALSMAPHPSLPGLIMALTPIWLFIVNHIRRVEDELSIPASILIIVGAVGLLLSSMMN